MLSIEPLRVGREAYYLSGVAESLDAYYTGSGEAAGRWVGAGADRLGLAGEVDPEDLRAVLGGMAPGQGGLDPIGKRPVARKKRVPGFDLTFKAPKSASVLYAVADDPRIQGALIEAGEHAFEAAIGWLERDAIQVQRGSHNKAWIEKKRAEGGDEVAALGPRRLPARGLVVAGFRHRTSRAGDPLLHWHGLVANMVEGEDGKWSAFVHPEVYARSKAAGEVFQAAYREHLSQSLGAEWRPGKHVPEIAGVPDHVNRLFSKRSAEIEAWLQTTGIADDLEGRQKAALATRRNKPEVEDERFDAAWKQEAAEAGWGPEQADQLVASWGEPEAETGYDEVWKLPVEVFNEAGVVIEALNTVTKTQWVAELLDRELTVSSTTFTQPQLVAAVAKWLGPGASPRTIERVADRVLADDQVLPVGDEGRFTSQAISDIEHRFIIAGQADSDGRGGVDDGLIEAAIGRYPTIGEDQAAAVRQLVGDDHPLSVMIGKAGTGKTFTLQVIREIWETAGLDVPGVSPAAKGARELEAGAGLAATTMHSLLGRWNRGIDLPSPQTRLVVDEAGMADIRTLERVVSFVTHHGGRVLLVGDHHQLPEVGAGGGFAWAASNISCVAPLTINRRQQEMWERGALDELREGDVTAAVRLYIHNDRVVTVTEPSELAAAAIDKYFTLDGRTVLLAGDNATVDKLNQEVVEHLAARGDLPSEPEHRYGSLDVRTGERVVTRANATLNHGIRIANGDVGTITAINADGSISVQFDRGAHIRLDHTYLEKGGRIQHAYALTGHRAQGGTWDHVVEVGMAGLYREGAYTMLSRGKQSNWLVLTEPEAASIADEAERDIERHDTGLDPEEPNGVLEELVERMSRCAAKTLAHMTDPQHRIAATVARDMHIDDVQQRLAHARQAARIANDTHGVDVNQLLTQLERLDHTARHIYPGVRVKALDRHNIGTVTDVNDSDGTAHVMFISTDGRQGERTLAWGDLAIMDRGTARRVLSNEADSWLDLLYEQHEIVIEAWRDTVIGLGSHPDDQTIYGHALRSRIDRLTHLLTAEPPEWLHDLIGDRPDDPTGAGTWDDAVEQIAITRDRLNLPNDIPGIGPRPEQPGLAEHWDRVSTQLLDTRQWLDTSDRLPTLWPMTPSRTELEQRLDQLDEILDSAPADTRSFIRTLQSTPLTDPETQHELQQAIHEHGQRKEWILTNWPHIVEHDHVTQALHTQRWGPDPSLLDTIDPNQIDQPLRDAAGNPPIWLRRALCAVATQDTAQLDPDDVIWLNQVANYRQTHHITIDNDPLGLAPLNPHDRTQWQTLHSHLTQPETPTHDPTPQPLLPEL